MVVNRFLSILLICSIATTQGRQESFFGRRNHDHMKLTKGSRRMEDDSRECCSPSLRQNCEATLDTAALLSLRGGAIPTAPETLLGQGSVVHNFLEAIDVFGTGVFAFAGALKAGKKGMDLLGMLIIACITAVGGGTIRELFLGTGGRAIFWMRNPLYIKICAVTTLATYCLWPILEKEFGFKDSAVVICLADALGLAAFSVMGTQRAVRKNLPPTLWIASGVITSVFGGIIRDVICGEPPRVMYPYQTMYGAGPAIGSSVYTLLSQTTDFETDLIASIAFLVTFAIRIASFNNPWRLPHWPEEETKKKR